VRADCQPGTFSSQLQAIETPFPPEVPEKAPPFEKKILQFEPTGPMPPIVIVPIPFVITVVPLNVTFKSSIGTLSEKVERHGGPRLFPITV
jgi:hypothetical protein